MGRTTIGTPVWMQLHGPAGKLLFNLKVASITNGGNTVTSVPATLAAAMQIPFGSWITLVDAKGNYCSDSRMQQGFACQAGDKVTLVYNVGLSIH